MADITFSYGEFAGIAPATATITYNNGTLEIQTIAWSVPAGIELHITVYDEVVIIYETIVTGPDDGSAAISPGYFMQEGTDDDGPTLGLPLRTVVKGWPV